jgi:Type IV secretory system Conjugative DNA transfer
MVSRQETARPLLTPGEVMQLPHDDELVRVSGCHPIRAKKARYYEDAEMKARILPPPTLARQDTASSKEKRQRMIQRTTGNVAHQIPLDGPTTSGCKPSCGRNPPSVCRLIVRQGWPTTRGRARGIPWSPGSAGVPSIVGRCRSPGGGAGAAIRWHVAADRAARKARRHFQ